MKKKHWTIRLKEEIQTLKGELEKTKEEKERYRENYMRVAAEFDNYKKRMQEEWKKMVDYANERLIFELLPVLDNFRRALDALQKSKDFDSLKRGVEMIFRDLLKVLEKEGLKTFDSKGKPFDPRIHEAISTIETDDVLPGTIVEEHEKGYYLKDKLLRPAKVVVAKSPEGAKSSDEEPMKGGK